MINNLKPSEIEAITKQNLLAIMSKLPADVPNILTLMEKSKRDEIQDKRLENLMRDGTTIAPDSQFSKLLAECIEQLNLKYFKRSK
jgi:hypothetical protein